MKFLIQALFHYMFEQNGIEAMLTIKNFSIPLSCALFFLTVSL